MIKNNFQGQATQWGTACFGEEVTKDVQERVHRFVEEAVELAQSLGCTKEELGQIVDYVFNRPVGEPHQEVGGVMVTLALLCNATNLDMEDLGHTELIRNWSKIEKIREKWQNKPKFSPLPQEVKKTRQQLFDEVIWGTTFCFEDIYNNMNRKQKKMIDALTDKELETFLSNNQHLMNTEFESGIMSGWDAVASTIADDLNYPVKETRDI